MSAVSVCYEKLFDKLYKSGVYHLHANFDSLTVSEKHYAFEVTRRFLDICRITNKHWPNTAKYTVAIHGDSILEQVYGGVLDESCQIESLEEATFASLKKILSITADPIGCALLDFEKYLAQGKKIDFISDPEGLNEKIVILFKTEFDFINFYHTVDYYRRTSAPTTLYKHIKLIRRELYAVCNTSNKS